MKGLSVLLAVKSSRRDIYFDIYCGYYVLEMGLAGWCRLFEMEYFRFEWN